MATFRTIARERSATSILDSGSAYGYVWQQPAIPENMPQEYARPHVFSDGVLEPNIMLSTAVLLDNLLPIDERETHAFRLWAHLHDPNQDQSWFELADEYMRAKRERRAKGWYEDGDGPLLDNTYNNETDLDQDFHITSPGMYCDYHLISLHTGCDIRGGYATPVVVCGDLEELLCSERISFYCHHCDASADNQYDAERDGWKPRLNKRSVSMVCPKCHHVAVNFPIDPVQLAADAKRAASAA